MCKPEQHGRSLPWSLSGYIFNFWKAKNHRALVSKYKTYINSYINCSQSSCAAVRGGITHSFPQTLPEK